MSVRSYYILRRIVQKYAMETERWIALVKTKLFLYPEKHLRNSIIKAVSNIKSLVTTMKKNLDT